MDGDGSKYPNMLCSSLPPLAATGASQFRPCHTSCVAIGCFILVAVDTSCNEKMPLPFLASFIDPLFVGLVDSFEVWTLGLAFYSKLEQGSLFKKMVL